ncbi:hypothetical protein A9G42_12195 [Gilliamella sp. Nev6-6]|uniref:hypothetical protein n=1 Tax=Gilliamella sp. Nev6-6 TaxID=3120252 RepID=UPI00080F4057|nr:hypothetical protein [Gilliamella apicola]OCG72519.1 hypothetical protein A9G42_12195 [Gilliamella apicola]
MFSALHPYNNKLISYTEYLKFALDHNFQKPNDAPGARCPVCERRLKVRAGKQKDDGHFYHNDEYYCPTKEANKRSYGNLPITKQNAEIRQKNLNFAKENIGKIWERLKEIIPFFDFSEFLSILNEAKKLNIYEYTNLNPQLLPYVYVTLINYLPSKSYNKQRKLKFCFFYEARINTYEDLWINQGAFSRLVRISYKNGSTQKVTIIETNTDYLSKEQVILSEKQLEFLKKKV